MRWLEARHLTKHQVYQDRDFGKDQFIGCCTQRKEFIISPGAAGAHGRRHVQLLPECNYLPQALTSLDASIENLSITICKAMVAELTNVRNKLQHREFGRFSFCCCFVSRADNSVESFYLLDTKNCDRHIIAGRLRARALVDRRPARESPNRASADRPWAALLARFRVHGKEYSFNQECPFFNRARRMPARLRH